MKKLLSKKVLVIGFMSLFLLQMGCASAPKKKDEKKKADSKKEEKKKKGILGPLGGLLGK